MADLGRVRMDYTLVLGCLAVLWLGNAAAQVASSAPPTTCLGTDIGDETPYASREVVCLRELRRVASRKGDLLTVRLENGTSKMYRDDPKACKSENAHDCIYHWLVSYHPKARVYSIGIQYYEGSGVELVNARSGKVLGLSGVPHFSPDGSRFIVVDNDYAYGGPYDLAVGSTANDTLTLEWQQRSEAGPPLEWRLQRWIDNDHIALRVFRADTGQECPHDDCDAILMHSENGWVIRRSQVKQQ